MDQETLCYEAKAIAIVHFKIFGSICSLNILPEVKSNALEKVLLQIMDPPDNYQTTYDSKTKKLGTRDISLNPDFPCFVQMLKS